uniref:Uncharacterized protein n=1 Tax=Petromyzon marinus TaxID=7757 RepID=S4RIL7_PETMA
ASYKELKEAFVSNLNGTNVSEIAILLTILPAGDFCRGLLGLFWAGSASAGAHRVAFVRDFLLLVLPYTLSTTVLAPHITLEKITKFAWNNAKELHTRMTSHACISRKKWHRVMVTFAKLMLNVSENPKEEGHVRCLTQFRAYTNLLTIVCILAVDFRAFPRRFAKTEIHGTGLMDLGVGTFVLSNALVSPEAR